MKLTKILATALVSLFAMSAAVSAAEPVCLFDFTDPEYTALWSAAATNNITHYYDEEEGCYRLDSTGTDPYTHGYRLSDEEKFDTGAATWMKICYKTTGEEVGVSQFHWANDNYSAPHGDTNFNWQREGNPEEWVEQVVEIIPTGTGDNTTAWTTTLQLLRIDPFHEEEVYDRTMWIKYIAFFATEEDAKAWTFAAEEAEPETPAVETTTPAPSEGAAQTADTFSVAIAALACAAAAGAVICSKKR